MNDIIREDIKAMKVYAVQDSKNMVKLDAMENPHGFGESYKKKWLTYLLDSNLNRYPDPKATSLQAGIKTWMGIGHGTDFILGNGSDELIQIIIMSLAKDRGVMALTPSFVMYRNIARLVGIPYYEVCLNADFTINVNALIEAIQANNPSVVFIANPNNPTGNLFPRNAIETLIQSTQALVVVDEAYYNFASDSFMADISKYDNLLVLRTMSKIGLAGIRLGALAGKSQWIDEFDKVRLPYNINTLTQKTLDFVIQYPKPIQKQIELIKTDRTDLFNALCQIERVEPFKSEANFILFRVLDANKTYYLLKSNGILVKNMNGFHPFLDNCLRVTVGTADENQQFLQKLKLVT